MDKYEVLLDNFMALMEEIEDEILIRGYDITKLQDNLKKTEHEA